MLLYPFSWFADWNDGFDIDEMCKSMVNRLKFLVNVTRQGTIQTNEKPEVPNNEDFFSYQFSFTPDESTF